MKKILLTIGLLLVIATMAMAGGQKDDGKVVIKYNILENDQTPQGITMHAFADKVAELSGGTITVETYASGSLFTQDGAFTAMMSGDLPMSNVAFQDIAAYVPSSAMFTAPYVIRSYEHMDKIFTSKAIQSWYDEVSEKTGVTIIGYMTQGVRTINSRFEDPIVTPADLEGFNLRMPGGAAWTSMGESLGANIVSVAYAELYAALQSGLVDGQDNPYAGDVAMKFYEVTKQISKTNHLVNVILIGISDKLWNSLDEQQQGWIREAAAYGGAQGTKATIDGEAANLKIMTDYGLIVTEADIDAFAEYSHQYYIDNNLMEDWDMDLYNALVELAE